MPPAPLSVEPRRACVLHRMQIETYYLERPGGRARAAAVAGPYVLVQRDECGEPILGEEAEQRADVGNVI